VNDLRAGTEALLDGLAAFTKITAEHLAADELVLFLRADRGEAAMAFKYDHGRMLVSHADADGFHNGFSAIHDAPALEDHTTAVGKIAERDDHPDEPSGEQVTQHAAALLLKLAEQIAADEVVFYVRRSSKDSPELGYRYLRGKVDLAAGPAGTFARAYGSFARTGPTDISEAVDQQFDAQTKAMALFSGGDAQDRMWAKVLALGVRNGVEDLHADGAFDDSQAPAFNRLVRGRIYESLAVLRAAGAPDVDADSPVMDWVIEHFDPEPDDGLTAAVPNAVEDAVETFAHEHDLSEDIMEQLVDDALAGAAETVDLFLRLGDEDAQRHLTFLLLSLPDEWEEPEMRPEVAALLSRT
jgi:hypothetical protein